MLQLGNSGGRVPLTVPPLPGSRVPGSAAHLGPTPSARAGHGPVADPRWGQVVQAPQLGTSKGSVPPPLPGSVLRSPPGAGPFGARPRFPS